MWHERSSRWKRRKGTETVGIKFLIVGYVKKRLKKRSSSFSKKERILATCNKYQSRYPFYTTRKTNFTDFFLWENIRFKLQKLFWRKSSTWTQHFLLRQQAQIIYYCLATDDHTNWFHWHSRWKFLFVDKTHQSHRQLVNYNK